MPIAGKPEVNKVRYPRYKKPPQHGKPLVLPYQRPVLTGDIKAEQHFTRVQLAMQYAICLVRIDMRINRGEICRIDIFQPYQVLMIAGFKLAHLVKAQRTPSIMEHR